MMTSVTSLGLLAFAPASLAGFTRSNSLSTHWQDLDAVLGPDTTLSSSTHFFTEQLVDHFAPAGESLTYRQRYHIDDKFWCGSGCPVFVMVGGEGPQGPVSERQYMATLAREQGALMIAVEHRFYGESRPTPDMSTESLRVLTSQQALADLANFIEYVKEFDPATADTGSTPPLSLRASLKGSPWVTFGGSYPGALSAWFRLKYPASTVGAVASSAPVMAEANFIQYAEVVGKALRYPLIGGSPACFEAIESAASTLADLVRATDPRGVSTSIPQELRPCTPIASELDLSTYEANVFGDFQGAVQYNGEGAGATVKKICSVMADESIGTPLERLAKMQHTFHPLSLKERCVDSNFQKDMMSDLVNTTFSKSSGSMRQWIYQSCNEFGFFQTTESQNKDLNAFHSFASVNYQNAGQEICKQAYGITGRPDTHWSNVYYGGRNVAGSNIVFVNGNSDPWHSLSVVNASALFYQSCSAPENDLCPPQKTTESERIVFIDGTAHCGDMYQPNLLGPDTGPIVWAHAVISESVAKFLAQAKTA